MVQILRRDARCRWRSERRASHSKYDGRRTRHEAVTGKLRRVSRGFSAPKLGWHFAVKWNARTEQRAIGGATFSFFAVGILSRACLIAKGRTSDPKST